MSSSGPVLTSIICFLLCFWLCYFEINSGVLFHSNDTKKDAKRLGGFATLADNLAHIVWVHDEREEYAHLIYGTRRFDRLGVIHECFDGVFEKCLVWFHRDIC